MTAELSPRLQAALDRAMEGRSRAGLAERVKRTSNAYRSGEASAGVIREAQDALAYALTRLPATYAAAHAAFTAAQAAAPGFAPAQMLDVGAGPGSASWAGVDIWPSLKAVTWLEANPRFVDIARSLSADGPPALAQAQVRLGDISAQVELSPSALVVASYVLAEIAQAKQAAVVARLWDACTGLLALVEPGTPAGYGRLLAARSQLIAAGAQVAAPCPHEAACPLAAPDWCHFNVRLPRRRDHRLAKGAEAPFEDEKFAYLVVARPEVAVGPRAARVLARPRAGKPGIALKLCTSGGLETRFVPRRDRAAHARARRLEWGDVTSS